MTNATKGRLRAGAVREGREMAEQLAQFTNSFDNGCQQAFAEGMLRQHRTLQQNVVRMFMSYMDMLAEQDDYDLRNQASIRLAKRIKRLMDDEHVTLPFV